MKDNQTSLRVRIPEEGEILGQVVQLLGNRLLLVRCTDTRTRKVRISGKHRRRMWVNLGDVIAIMPDYGMSEDEKGTMTYRYTAKDAIILFENNFIPEEYLI